MRLDEYNSDSSKQTVFFENDDIALTLNSNIKVSKNEWFIDSAASSHMTYDKDILMDFTSYGQPSQVFLGDNTAISATGEGKVRLPTYDDAEDVYLALNKVLFVPKLAKNLLSVRAMTNMGAEVTFDKEKCVILKDNKRFTIGHVLDGKLYRVNTPEFANFTESCSVPSLELWHFRLGHLNHKYVDQLAKKNLAVGMKYCANVTDSENCIKCEACTLGKMHRNSFPKQSQHRATQVLEIIHSDVCGPMQVESIGGNKYMLTFTDDYSRYTTVYFLKNKSEVFAKFKQYVSQIENRTGHKIKNLNILNKNVKSLRTDNGGEYTSNEFKKYCTEKGIFREFTNPHTPEQNGVSERLNRTIIETVRSMIFHAKLPLRFWAEAANTAVYLRNRSPTVSLGNKTPYECWFDRKPDISNLRVFGCLSYVHVPDCQRQKLDPKSYKAIFVGYPEGTKGYKLYNVKTSHFVRSRSVLFHEYKFYQFDYKLDVSEKFVIFPDVTDNDLNSTVSNTEADPAIANVECTNVGENLINVPVTSEVPVVETDTVPVGDADINKAVQKTYEETFMQQVQNLGDKRQRTVPSRLIESLNVAEECLFVDSLTSEVDEPKSMKVAMNSEHSAQWKEAMQCEYISLLKNETWELVPSPRGINIVGCRWVFKVKRNADGTIDRFKARLVAQGYSQTYGVDYSEVFSPVARFSAIRLLFALANASDLEIHQMDVKTAFLNGSLDCEVYMAQPEGFVDSEKKGFVCKLKKSIYGLKQSARCWNDTLNEHLKSAGYCKSGADGCIYMKSIKNSNGHVFVIFAVYMDDIITVSNNIIMLNAEKAALCERFDMVDNGEVHYILGMLIKRNRKDKVLSISQPSYLNNMLVRFRMEDCKPVSTPLEPGKHFHKFLDGDKPFDTQIYQQAIGCLTYAATATRPDIAAAVGVLSQYMSNPSEDHWIGVKRILRYIRNIKLWITFFCWRLFFDWFL